MFVFLKVVSVSVCACSSAHVCLPAFLPHTLTFYIAVTKYLAETTEEDSFWLTISKRFQSFLVGEAWGGNVLSVKVGNFKAGLFVHMVAGRENRPTPKAKSCSNQTHCRSSSDIKILAQTGEEMFRT